jgi:CheY-like chemotaxis protein/two-component sensor histidine kinase
MSGDGAMDGRLVYLNRAGRRVVGIADDAELADVDHAALCPAWVYDLLDVSRITSGKLQLRRERVALSAVVQCAVEASRPAIDAGGHALTIELPVDGLELDADPTRLAQVLSNLLINAAKYSDAGGRIALTAARDGDDVVIAVKDDGVGIAAEHLPALFQIFFQVSHEPERSKGGLGIGLSLVRGLVELHGGTVSARSDGPGRGSEFSVRLPLAAGGRAVGASPPSPSPPPPASPGSARILIVDDNVDAAETLAMVLALDGHDVTVAHDGARGLQLAEESRPQLVLLDIGLPKLNGYEVARRIRQQPWGRAMTLVAITGWGQEDDKRRAREAGFDLHLTKPIAPGALDRLLATTTRRT